MTDLRPTSKKLLNKHAMNNSTRLVTFTLGNNRFALPLSQVERIVNVVKITPLPKAPEIVIGVVNIQGRIIPVFDIRKRFRLLKREMNTERQAYSIADIKKVCWNYG